MASSGNRIYSMVQSFTRESQQAEWIIYGFARVFSMQETALSVLLDAEAMKKLDVDRKIFSERGLDQSKISTFMTVLLQFLRVNDEEEKKYRDYAAFLDAADDQTDSGEILKRALDTTVMPLRELFSGDNTDEARTAWKEGMRAKDANDAYHPVRIRVEEKTEKTSSSRVKDENRGNASAGSDGKGEPAEPEQAKNLVELSEQYWQFTTDLLDVVRGQDQAVFQFVRGCFQGDLFPVQMGSGHPRTYFFFFGPPGVGKTLLARKAAELMGRPFKQFDMNDYPDQYAVDLLIGTESFVSKGRSGILTDFVREHPDCVLLFDEFEKAGTPVIRTFLQVLGSGRLTDKYTGKEISFERATLIFTSNVGRDLYEDRSLNLSSQPRAVIMDAIRKENVFSPEICSRIAAGNLIMFNHLNLHFLTELTRKGFNRFVERMEQDHHCTVCYPEELPMLFLYRYGKGVDGRIAASRSEDFMKDELHELVWQVDRSKTDRIREIEFVIDENGMDPDISRLFKHGDKTSFLTLADPALIDELRAGSENCTFIAAANLEAKDLSASPLDENEDIVRIGWKLDNTDLSIYFDFTHEGYVHLYGREFISVPETKYDKVIWSVNDANEKYSFVKFILDKEIGEVTLEVDAVIQLDSCAEEAYELMGRCMQIADDAYPELMREMWA